MRAPFLEIYFLFAIRMWLSELREILIAQVPRVALGNLNKHHYQQREEERMLLGRLSRVAQRTSSVHLTRTFRPVIYGIRQYSAAAAQPVQTPVQEPLTPLDFIPDEIFKYAINFKF